MQHEKRTITPAQEREQLAGGRRLAPGVWVDRNGGLHFSAPDLLALLNVADTPANRDELTKHIREYLSTATPDASLVEQEVES